MSDNSSDNNDTSYDHAKQNVMDNRIKKYNNKFCLNLGCTSVVMILTTGNKSYFSCDIIHDITARSERIYSS